MVPLFDLHCDTLSTLFKFNFNFENLLTHISLEKSKAFQPYIQIGAIWSDFRQSNEEAFDSYKQNIQYIKQQNIALSTYPSMLESPTFILSVEDARLLNGHIDRLERLFNDGVRVLTLNWRGISCIGGGWDTDIGLTKLGYDVIRECIKMGIIIDLSHSSVTVQNQAFKLCENLGAKPIFSHSNSFSVCNHRRNLEDIAFKRILSLGGIVGISLCPEHLNNGKNAAINDIIKHIEHYISLGGENSTCLGCDFDGVSSLPLGINSIGDLTILFSELSKSFSKEIAEKIFFNNAYNFFIKNLTKGA